MILNLVSLFIVVPQLSGVPSIYGIYSICVSATIFLSYADLGFISACYKYASESFAKKDTVGEVKISAFGIFILIIFITLLSGIFFILSLKPEVLIKGLESDGHSIASNLFLILSLSSFSVILQRMLQIIFGIRLKDYLYQRINIISSLIKITSVLYFFRDGEYNIVGYFFFIQLMNYISAFIGLWIARKKFNYDFILFIKQIKYSKEVYQKTKNLAISSLIVTILWILYYELDSFAIAKLMGSTQVAFYAVGFALMTFLRSIFGTIYAPFVARFNHFIGLNDMEGLKKFYIQIILFTLPIVLLPVLSLIIFMKLFIVSWVGFNYNISIDIGIFLMLCYIISFISYPAGILMTALVKLKSLYIMNITIVIIYWGGILLTMNILGIESFAIFKFAAFLISGIYCVFFSAKFLQLNLFQFLKKIIQPSILPIISAVLILFFIRNFIPISEEKINMFYSIISGGFALIIFLLIYYFTCISFKEYCNYLFAKVNSYFLKLKNE